MTVKEINERAAQSLLPKSRAKRMVKRLVKYPYKNRQLISFSKKVKIMEKDLKRLLTTHNVWFEPSGNLFFRYNVDMGEYRYPRHDGGATVVEHLHQLQNLYFALTGEELEIKL